MSGCFKIRHAAVLLTATLLAPVAFAQNAVSTEEASRFLAQATLGANYEEIERTSAMGLDAWLVEQFDRPEGLHQPFLDSRSRLGLEVSTIHRRWSWWEQVMQGPDPLRQRVALALSEHFVVSDEVGDLDDNPIGVANYYDMLVGHAFGNYRDLLHDVAMHPIMGVYLSHLRNERSDPSRGRFPDENFAREIMQLFSIGLFRLHLDGTQVLDGDGRPIPTYDNDDITEVAKIFTGFAFNSPEYNFDEGREIWTSPMRMYDEFHEPGPKNLLRGQYVPAGQSGMQDFEDAIDNLFEHPNAGPFFARRLIQRLITSNPSPAYVERVATAFNDNGAGVRGDMQAVVRAVLTDPGARNLPPGSAIEHGQLRESFLRRVHLARAFDAYNLAFSFPIADGNADEEFAQRPMSSPTVFNFFLPDHQPQGEIANADLVGPEFQIVTSLTAISSANELQRQAYGVMNRDDDDNLEVRLDVRDEIAVAANAQALIDRLDLVMMYGNMSAAMRDIMLNAMRQVRDPEERVRMAIHLIAISPEYNVLK